MNTGPLIVERSYNASADTIWQAITDKEKMKEWYFDIKEFSPKVGFEFQFYGGEGDKRYLHLCRIAEVTTGKKLSYSWKYEGFPGESFVSFEIFPEGEKTRLMLTHKGLQSFPDNNPDFAAESFAKGWNYILGTSLKDFVEKQ